MQYLAKVDFRKKRFDTIVLELKNRQFCYKELYTFHCPKSNQNFREITRNEEENEIIHKIFCVISRFPHYISCYIYISWKIYYLWDSVM